MNEWIIMGIIGITVGFVFVRFNEKIMKLQGSNRKYDYPREKRKENLIVGGIVIILLGLFALLKGFELI